MKSPSNNAESDTLKCSVGAQWASVTLLQEVDFKWLMAGQGCWVDPTRLRADPRYAADCLGRAMHSTCEPLRRCAVCLLATLGMAQIH